MRSSFLLFSQKVSSRLCFVPFLIANQIHFLTHPHSLHLVTSTESSTGASTGVLHPKVLDKRWARQLRLFAKQRNDGRAVLRVAGISEAVVVLLLQVVVGVAFREMVEEAPVLDAVGALMVQEAEDLLVGVVLLHLVEGFRHLAMDILGSLDQDKTLSVNKDPSPSTRCATIWLNP